MCERGMSVLDGKPGRVLNFPLTVTHQLWFSFLLPSFIETIIYCIDLATDVAVGLALISEHHYVAGAFTLAMLYIPPLVCLVMRLKSPPQPPECKVVSIWFMLEILAFILFPLRPLQCFSERLFWSIEALRLNDPEREEALLEHERTHTSLYLESYLFLQAYLHAAPQAILQLGLIVTGVSRDDHTKLMEGVCVLTSIGSIALITAYYQRYETQCSGGRMRVWASQDEKDASDGTLLNEMGNEIRIPKRLRWTKVMAEDNPLGMTVSFTYWFLLLVGRLLCLVVAAHFFPWAVLGVCVAHYLFSLLYILPSPDCTTSIPIKLGLAVIYIFCLVEVGVTFRKASLFYGLFFTFTFVENFVLTLVWALWGNWTDWWFHYALFVMIMTHILGLVLLLIYVKYFRPQTKRVHPQH